MGGDVQQIHLIQELTAGDERLKRDFPASKEVFCPLIARQLSRVVTKGSPNVINRANLRRLVTADQWTDLVNEYFVYAKEEEGHEEEEGGETEPPEPEEDPPDPVEDEDEPLIIPDPVEKILQDEWNKCENFK